MDLPSDGQVSIDDLLEHIAAQSSIWIRVAAIEMDGTWHQALLEFTSGEAPPSWKRSDLSYSRAIFLSARRKGTSVASVLRRRRIRLHGYTIALPALPVGEVQVRRVDSGSQVGVFEALRWPSVGTELGMSSLAEAQYYPQDVLAANGYPTFMNFNAAATFFFGLKRDPSGGSVNRGMVYRHQDMQARIDHVRFGGKQVRIEVDGTRLAGTTLDVAGDVPGVSKRLRQTPKRAVRFILPDGLPTGAFIVLRRDGQWLDRRFLRWPHARGEQADVVEEVEVDAATKLELFLIGRENEGVEFKARLPGDTDPEKRTVMKTVAAFANGDGGSLLFGITKEHEAIGLLTTDLDDAQDRISDLIDDWISPRPAWSFEVYPVERRAGYAVLALHVSQGAAPPYSIGTRSAPTAYYVRHGGRSVPARPDELRALARSRPTIAVSSPTPLGRF